MLVKNFALVLKLTNLATTLKAIPIKWDGKSRKMILLPEEMSKKAHVRGCVYTTLVAFLNIQICFAAGFSNLDSDFLTKVLLGLALVNPLTGEVFNRECRKNVSVLVSCINGYLQFYSMHQKGMLSFSYLFKILSQSFTDVFKKNYRTFGQKVQAAD